MSVKACGVGSGGGIVREVPGRGSFWGGAGRVRWSNAEWGEGGRVLQGRAGHGRAETRWVVEKREEHMARCSVLQKND